MRNPLINLYRKMFGYPGKSNFRSVLKDMPNILIGYIKKCHNGSEKMGKIVYDKNSPTYRKMFGSSKNASIETILQPVKDVADKAVIEGGKTYRKMFGGGNK